MLTKRSFYNGTTNQPTIRKTSQNKLVECMHYCVQKNDIEIIWQTWTEHGHWPFILIPWVCPANFSEQSAAFVNPALIVLKVRLNPNQSISESIDQRSQTDTIGLHRLCVCVCVWTFEQTLKRGAAACTTRRRAGNTLLLNIWSADSLAENQPASFQAWLPDCAK